MSLKQKYIEDTLELIDKFMSKCVNEIEVLPEDVKKMKMGMCIEFEEKQEIKRVSSNIMACVHHEVIKMFIFTVSSYQCIVIQLKIFLFVF